MSHLRSYFPVAICTICSVFLLACSVQSDSLNESQDAKVKISETSETKIAKEEQTQQRARFAPRIQIARFYDARPEEIATPAEDKKEYSQPRGKVEALVTNALTLALKKKGVSISNDAKNLVKGEIRTWRIAKTPGVEAVDTKAGLYIEVVDETNRLVFSKVYEGNNEEQSKNRSDVNYSAGVALDRAVSQVVADEQLLSALSTE